MGVEYDIVSDKAHEGYELGKGSWCELPEALRATNPVTAVVALMRQDSWDDAWPNALATDVAREIVAFAEAHPDWRVIDDCSSDIWVCTDEDRAKYVAECRSLDGDDYEDEEPFLYRKVGSRYRE